MMISKIELKCFQINLVLELFMCLRLELLELFLKFYSLGITIFQFFSSQIFCNLDFILFFVNLHYLKKTFQPELLN